MLISGITDYQNETTGYFTEDTVFLSTAAAFYSNKKTSVTVTGRYVILSEPNGSSAVYCEREKSLTLMPEGYAMYYVFVGSAFVFSNDLGELLKKLHILTPTDYTCDFIDEIAKSIVIIEANNKITYNDKGLITQPRQLLWQERPPFR